MSSGNSHDERSAATDDELEDDGDFMDDYDCTWCNGEGQFWGSELPGYDPGWHLPDELYPCPACKGTGNRRNQVLF